MTLKTKNHVSEQKGEAKKREASNTEKRRKFCAWNNLGYHYSIDVFRLRQHVEGYQEDVKRTYQDNKIGDLVAEKLDYVPTRSICMDNIQKPYRT